MTSAEITRRQRMVRAGEWNHAWITLADGRTFFTARATVTEGGQIRFADSEDVAQAIVRPDQIERAVH